MAKRKVLLSDVMHVVETGEIIERYMEDKPFASKLIMGFCDGRPIHVVAADDPDNPGDVYVITVYEPNKSEWDVTFCKRVEL